MSNVIVILLLVFGILALAEESTSNRVHDAQGSMDTMASRRMDNRDGNWVTNLVRKVSGVPPWHRDLDSVMLGKRGAYSTFSKDDDLQVLVNTGDALDTIGNIRCTVVSSAKWPPKLDATIDTVVGSSSGSLNAALDGAASGWPLRKGGRIALKRYLGHSDIIGHVYCEAKSQVELPPQPQLFVSNILQKGAWETRGTLKAAMYTSPNIAGDITVEKTHGLLQPRFEGVFSAVHTGQPRQMAQFMNPRTRNVNGKGRVQITLAKKLGPGKYACSLGGDAAWPPHMSVTIYGLKETLAGTVESTMSAPIASPRDMLGAMTLRKKIGPIGVQFQMATNGKITCAFSGANRARTPLKTREQWIDKMYPPPPTTTSFEIPYFTTTEKASRLPRRHTVVTTTPPR